MDDNAQFEQITNGYLGGLYEAQPVMATAMGVHDGDDRLPDLSRHAIADELRRARGYLHGIDALSLAPMDAEHRLDCRLARSATQLLISTLEQASPWVRQPGAYLRVICDGVLQLLTWSWGDPHARAACAAARLRAVPETLMRARENLHEPPAVFTRGALDACAGAGEVARHASAALAEQASDPALRSELAEAAADAGAAIDDYAVFLREDLLPRSCGPYALGRDLYEYRLRIAHLVDATAEEVEALGLAELAEVEHELVRVGARIDHGRHWSAVVDDLQAQGTAPHDVAAAYRDEVARAREFVAAHALVDLPAPESLLVDAGAYAPGQLACATYVPAAPFDARQEGRLRVEARDPGPEPGSPWVPWAHSPFSIPIVAIHAGCPGHHVQMSRANAHPSRYRRHFGASELLQEGWALYCEALMREAGYYHDPRVEMMQLRERALRACRMVAGARLHSGAIDVDGAANLLIERAHVPADAARTEVGRILQEPTSAAAGPLGMREILALRDRVERRRGKRFVLREFHNDLLAYGSVPVRLVREEILAA